MPPRRTRTPQPAVPWMTIPTAGADPRMITWTATNSVELTGEEEEASEVSDVVARRQTDQVPLFSPPATPLAQTLRLVRVDHITIPAGGGAPASDEMVESVRLLGVLQPVLLRQTAPRSFAVVYGRRRVNAARRAGLESIPAAIITESLPDYEAAVALTENNLRDDNPISDLRTIETLMANGSTVERIARTLRIPQRTIVRRLRLRSLIPVLRTETEAGTISLNVATQISRMTGVEQRRLAGLLRIRREDSAWRNRRLLLATDVATASGTPVVQFDWAATAAEVAAPALPVSLMAELEALRVEVVQLRLQVSEQIVSTTNITLDGTDGTPEGWNIVAALLSRAIDAMPVEADDTTDNWYAAINDLRVRAQAQLARA